MIDQVNSEPTIGHVVGTSIQNVVFSLKKRQTSLKQSVKNWLLLRLIIFSSGGTFKFPAIADDFQYILSDFFGCLTNQDQVIRSLWKRHDQGRI